MIQLPFCSIDKCCRSKDNSCCTWPAELTPYDWLPPADRSVQHQSPALHCDLYMSIDEIVKVNNNSILLIKGFPFHPEGEWSLEWGNMGAKTQIWVHGFIYLLATERFKGGESHQLQAEKEKPVIILMPNASPRNISWQHALKKIFLQLPLQMYPILPGHFEDVHFDFCWKKITKKKREN